MRILLLIFFLVLSSLGRSCLAAEELVKVALFRKDLPRQVKITAQHGLVVLDSEHKQIVLSSTAKIPLTLAWHKKGVRIIGWHGTGQIYSQLVIRLAHASEPLYLGHRQQALRPYAGELAITADKKNLLIVNSLPWPDYVAAVVSQEMPISWHEEALKAQAVASRTYAMKNQDQRHAHEPFHFCDLTHCQVYQGTQKISPKIQAVIRQTKGEVLLHKQELIDAVYHSCCGGQTASAAKVWPKSQAVPYLQTMFDQGFGKSYCQASPEFTWKVRLTFKELKKLFPQHKLRLKTVPAMRVLEKSRSQRVQKIQISTSKQDLVLTGQEWYRIWGHARGWHQLKSTKFEIKQAGNEFIFIGQGLGHGVGLCQWGAQGRAQSGQTYREILSAYFIDTHIGNRYLLPVPDVTR